MKKIVQLFVIVTISAFILAAEMAAYVYMRVDLWLAGENNVNFLLSIFGIGNLILACICFLYLRHAKMIVLFSRRIVEAANMITLFSGLFSICIAIVNVIEDHYPNVSGNILAGGLILALVVAFSFASYYIWTDNGDEQYHPTTG